MATPSTPSVPGIYGAIARALAPRPALTVSEWADKERRLSSKGSAMAGQWSVDMDGVSIVEWPSTIVIHTVISAIHL